MRGSWQPGALRSGSEVGGTLSTVIVSPYGQPLVHHTELCGFSARPRRLPRPQRRVSCICRGYSSLSGGPVRWKIARPARIPAIGVESPDLSVCASTLVEGVTEFDPQLAIIDGRPVTTDFVGAGHREGPAPTGIPVPRPRPAPDPPGASAVGVATKASHRLRRREFGHTIFRVTRHLRRALPGSTPSAAAPTHGAHRPNRRPTPVYRHRTDPPKPDPTRKKETR